MPSVAAGRSATVNAGSPKRARETTVRCIGSVRFVALTCDVIASPTVDTRMCACNPTVDVCASDSSKYAN